MHMTHCKTCGASELHEPKTNRSVAILLAGFGLGAATGLMLARASGAELRKEIRNCTNDTFDYLKTEGDALVKQAGNMVDSVSDAAGETLNQARGMVRKAGKFVQENT